MSDKEVKVDDTPEKVIDGYKKRKVGLEAEREKVRQLFWQLEGRVAEVNGLIERLEQEKVPAESSE